MNQLNELLTADDVQRGPDPLAAGESIESILGPTDVSTGSVPDPAGGTVPEKGRVLLIEDDEAFREIVRDCLAANGYTVVAVQNGGEGVREVLSSDFALVLCDFMMPGLPGDMFFHAALRIRPSLRKRFVFMTGHQCDALTDAFIKSVDGFVLRKPFPLNHLLDAIAFAETREMHQSLFADSATGLNPPQSSESVSGFQTDGITVSEAAQLERILARAMREAGRAAPPEAPAESKPWIRKIGLSAAFAGLAILLGLLVSRWSHYREAREDAGAAVAKRETAEAEWSTTSRDLQTAIAARPRIEAEIRKLEQILGDRALPPWSPGLRSLVVARDVHIEIIDVRARGHMEDSGACNVRISGLASGPEPRLTAERFRQQVETGFKRIGNGDRARARFDQLEDVPGAVPEQSRAAFLIVATVEPINPPELPGKEVR